MKWLALLPLLVLACTEQPAAPAAPAQSLPEAALAYCKHERPLVIEDPIQSKNIAAAEEKSGQPATIRDEAKWIPSCVQRQMTLKQKYDDEKVMAYFACAMKESSLVDIRTKCFRSVFPPAKVTRDPAQRGG
jgi:hypothetical protein